MPFGKRADDPAMFSFARLGRGAVGGENLRAGVTGDDRRIVGISWADRGIHRRQKFVLRAGVGVNRLAGPGGINLKIKGQRNGAEERLRVGNPDLVNTNVAHAHVVYLQGRAGLARERQTILRPLIGNGRTILDRDGEAGVGPEGGGDAFALRSDDRKLEGGWLQVPSEKDVADDAVEAIDLNGIIDAGDRIEGN